MLKIVQVKRLALRNAQGSTDEGFREGVGGRCGARSAGADLSAGVVFGAPEVAWGVLSYRKT